MEMLVFTLISIALLALGAWSILSGRLYRQPFALYLIGFLLALGGGYIAYGLDLGSQNGTVSKFFTHLKLASSFVSYTFAAAGGSLIASGIVLKAQHQAQRDYLKAKACVDLILDNIRIIQLSAKEILDNPAIFPLEQQEKRLRALRERFCDQTIALRQATDQLDRMAHL